MRESVDPPIFIFSSYCEGGQAITVQHSPSSICCAAKIQNSFIYTDVGKKNKNQQGGHVSAPGDSITNAVDKHEYSCIHT